MITRLHSSLLLGEFGVWVMGVCAIVWFITLFLGIALSLPKSGNKLSSWASLFKVRLKQGHYKINYDLHQSLSVLIFPILVIVSFTGIYLNFPDLVKPIINVVSPLTPSPQITSEIPYKKNASAFSVDDAIIKIKSSFPKAVVSSVNCDPTKGVYNIRFYLPGDVSKSGSNNAYISKTTGQIQYVKLAKNGSVGDAFVSWMHPLHNGNAFGIFGQIVILISAVILSVICVTGLNIYLGKLSYRQKRAI